MVPLSDSAINKKKERNHLVVMKKDLFVYWQLASLLH